jgi:hypothetical protein
MVPLDRPAEALAMITSFVQRRPLDVAGQQKAGSGGGGKIAATVVRSAPDKRDKRQRYIKGRKKNRSDKVQSQLRGRGQRLRQLLDADDDDDGNGGDGGNVGSGVSNSSSSGGD